MTRQATNKILEMVDEGILDKDTVIMSCLKYMSEDDVADMAHSNEFFINEEEDEPEMEDDPEGLVDIIPDYPEKEDE
jgi:hypothetical protein